MTPTPDSPAPDYPVCELSQVRTPADVLNRAAAIALRWNDPVTATRWMPVGSNLVLSALTHAAYPSASSGWNAYREPWWPEHMRIRAMDVEAQAVVRSVTGWPRLHDWDRTMQAEEISNLLRAAAIVAERKGA